MTVERCCTEIKPVELALTVIVYDVLDIGKVETLCSN